MNCLIRWGWSLHHRPPVVKTNGHEPAGNVSGAVAGHLLDRGGGRGNRLLRGAGKSAKRCRLDDAPAEGPLRDEPQAGRGRYAGRRVRPNKARSGRIGRPRTPTGASVPRQPASSRRVNGSARRPMTLTRSRSDCCCWTCGAAATCRRMTLAQWSGLASSRCMHGGPGSTRPARRACWRSPRAAPKAAS
jgi:hypothetical protein